MSRNATLPALRLCSSCLVSSSSSVCCRALSASWIWLSAFTVSVRATAISASISAILRRAVSTAASCLELSNLKTGAPWEISPVKPT